MTNKELRKLSRAELLEVLITQSKEINRLNGLLTQATQMLESRKIAVEEAGSIAMASMKLNEVFESAQKAADLYLTNIRERADACEKMEQDTREKCEKMLEQAQSAGQRYLDQISRKLQVLSSDNDDLRMLLSTIDPPGMERYEEERNQC